MQRTGVIGLYPLSLRDFCLVKQFFLEKSKTMLQRYVTTNKSHPFGKHLTMSQLQNLRLRDEVDYRDNVGRYCLAKIIAKNSVALEIKLHYIGWSHQWDEWVSFDKSNIYRFCKARSISRRPGTKFVLRVGDKIDINYRVSKEIYGWKMGCVRAIDNDSGQIQVVFRANCPSDSQLFAINGTDKDTNNYNNNNKKKKTKNINNNHNDNERSINYIQRWSHMDNIIEIDEFTTRSLFPNNEISRVQYQFKKMNTTQNVSMQYENYLHFMKKLNSMYPCGYLLVYGYFRRKKLSFNNNNQRHVEISFVRVLPSTVLNAIVRYLDPCLLYILSDIIYSASIGQHITKLINTHSFEMDGKTDLNAYNYDIHNSLNSSSSSSSKYKKYKFLFSVFTKIHRRVLKDWLIYCQPYTDNTVHYFKIANQQQKFGMVGTNWLYPILHYNSYIKQLILTNNSLDDECLKYLIKAISTNNHSPPISLLNISDNKGITDQGCKLIFKTLLISKIKSNYDYRYLTELYLNGLSITDQTIVLFTQFIRKYPKHNIKILSVLNNTKINTSPLSTMKDMFIDGNHNKELQGIKILIDDRFKKNVQKVKEMRIIITS